jgi:glycine/D-amino acid oxidase-like deaminating enzyme
MAGMSGELGRRAVVVGAGIGGLSAAGVLARYFDQIDVLERDQTPLSVESRSGTPQDKHAHGLLALPCGKKATSPAPMLSTSSSQ